MGALVSNCASDEHGGAYGGAAGDQTGREYRVRDWYDFGQTAVYRHPNAKVRATLARLATDAANNDHIGYDQSQRLTFRNALRKAGYEPSRITVNCESDCSASTGAIIEATGKLLGDTLLYAFDTTLSTHYMDGPLQAAGFQKLTDARYTRSGDHLLAGDICLRPANHVNIVVRDGDMADTYTVTWLKAPQRCTVTGKVAIVREQPKTSAKIVARYQKGEHITIEGITPANGRWWGVYVGASTGLTRFVSLDAVRPVVA